MTEVKERPILFSTPMVQAILEGRKTQTRRVVKPQPSGNEYQISTLLDTTNREKVKHIGKHQWVKMDRLKHNIEESDEVYFKCPYGSIGDVLWVRETWHDGDFLGLDAAYIYKASDNGKAWEENSEGWKWRPSIFMPRAACRIKLEITDIRVERLHQISDDDAKAEGAPDHLKKDDFERMKTIDFTIPSPFLQYQFGFMALWTKINGNASWEANPWIWAIIFKEI